MDFKFGNLIFSSNFDSGNLHNVERVVGRNDDNVNNQNNAQPEPIKMDYEFNIWTKPDCYGTEFENGNRTWFHFSVKGYLPGKMIRMTIKNLNRQQRLYAQGYCPLFRTEGSGKDSDNIHQAHDVKFRWLRVRYRPTWENNENNFQLTFTHRLLDLKYSSTYFAFCYPWSYGDCQKQLETLDLKYELVGNCNVEMLSKFDRRTIYYKRELFTRSLEGRRIDLITITDLEGLRHEREENFDEKLFPEKADRPWKFRDKKVFVVTSRVHPGETPSSHVFNGFLNFILRPDDARSLQLRKQYIFKLIPLLNPDGVYNGHYRTDSRGVNLNRVYLSPDYKLHSPIYAAKSLLVYHHIVNSDEPKYKLTVIKSKVYNSISFAEAQVERQSPGVVIPNQLTASKHSLDEQDTILVVEHTKVSEVGDYQFPIIPRTVSSNILIETHELPLGDSQTPHISPKIDNNEYTMVNKSQVSDNVFIENCPEVVVDLQSLKYDFEPLNPAPIHDAENSTENSVQLVIEQNPSEEKSVLLNNERNKVQKQSIYRLFKPSNRSNSISALSTKTRHQWNLHGNHSNDIIPKAPTQSAIRSHKNQRSSMIPLPLRPSIVSMRFSSKTLNRGISIDNSQLSSLKKDLPACTNNFKSEPKIGNEGSDDDSDLECYAGQNENQAASSHLCDASLLDIASERSGIAFYVDLHGHCSKRGCFMYGNSLESEKNMNDIVLFPKLISLNSPHFDFLGCNFSLKNMYTKDKRDGTSKEGAGRVAIWKHLGLIHSYTLECNYNTGRTVNWIPQTSKDEGRASPVQNDTSCSLPPKFTPYHFEDVGKAMAIASLDMTQTNPWSRIINSEYTTLQNIREYVRKFLSGQKNGFRPSISFRQRNNRPVKQPSNANINPLSKTFSNQLEYRRQNGSQGPVSMTVPRKSQPFLMSHFATQTSNMIKPILSNDGPVAIFNQDTKVVPDLKKKSVSANSTELHNGFMRISNSNLASSLTRIDLLMKPDSVRANIKSQESCYQKLSCNSASIVTKSVIKQEMPSLVKYNPTPIKLIEIDNNMPATNADNQNNSAAKQQETFRRNSIADCCVDGSPYDLLEKEKVNELKEILSDEKCFKNIALSTKMPTFNVDKRPFQFKKKQTNKKMLDKIISYSTNDINN